MSSNFGVSGETLILTENGYAPVHTIVNTNVNVWNGSEWSSTIIRESTEPDILYRVQMSDGSFIDCTGSFKLPTQEHNLIVERKVSELYIGDIIEDFEKYPIIASDIYKNNEQCYERLRDNTVPFDLRIFSRLLWLSKKIDKECGYMQITSDDIEWARQIKLLANTLGTSPFIVQTIRGYHLRFNSKDVEYLLDDLLLPHGNQPNDYYPVYQPKTTIVSILKLEGTHDTFHFSDFEKNRCILNGVYSCAY